MADTCSSCGAPIKWVITQAGKRMPLDPDPVENGNIEIAGTEPEAGVSIVRYLKKGERESPTLLAPPPRYVSHFFTCPNADLHRKGR